MSTLLMIAMLHPFLISLQWNINDDKQNHIAKVN